MWIHRSLLVAALLVCAGPSEASPAHVTIGYSPGLDSACASARGIPIKDEWRAELLSRQAEFETSWERVGPRLLKTTEEITGKAFPPADVTARLTLCETPSEAFAGTATVFVNMRYALKSFTPTPVPLRYKVYTLFHELLHLFLAAHPVKGSGLLAKHAVEPERVKDHLHLLALEKAVLLKLGESDVLKELVTVDSELPGGYYKRAWELVNATDTEYLKYVAEVAR